MLVCIDAGHGGTDPGAIGHGGIREKDYTLTQALVAESVIRAEGIDVILTRRADKSLPNYKRADFANLEGADVFISYHFNAANAIATGTQILHHRGSPRGQTLAHLLLNEIGPLDGPTAERWERVIGLPMDGFRGGNFIPTVLTRTSMTAVIVETEFGTNPRDAKQLADPKYILEVAQATVRAIARWAG